MKYTLTTSLLLTAFFAVLTLPSSAQAATLSFSAPATVPMNTEFTLTIVASSTDRGFNAAEATISFPKDILEVVSIDSAASSTIFNFWLRLPSFLNEQGIISFSGGTTHGIVGSDVPILTVRMRAKGVGDALVTASDASINASDGNGTNILEGIASLRIAVSKATISIPPKPATTTPPQKEIVPAAPTETPKEAEVAVCSEIFINCDLHFPIIKSVTVTSHQREGAGSDILVSGSASDGTRVHLYLRHKGILYKQLQSIIKEDRTWEGVFTEVYAYGEYTIDAITENGSNPPSQPATWTDIDVFPPYTLFIFGMVFRWYVVLGVVLGLLTLVSGLYLLHHHLVGYAEPYHKRRAQVVFILALLAYISMSVAAYFLWQAEYEPKVTFWKDTTIPCIHREHSFGDTYGSLSLHIFINGEPQVIPEGIGIAPQCIAQVHTHDTTGALHFEPTERAITLPDFFSLAATTLERKGYKLSVTVNGKDYTEGASTYALQNGDNVVVSYTTSR